MVRKIIGIALIVAAIEATIMSASAQSTTGRTGGCWDSNGGHHGPGWCANHGKQK